MINGFIGSFLHPPWIISLVSGGRSRRLQRSAHLSFNESMVVLWNGSLPRGPGWSLDDPQTQDLPDSQHMDGFESWDLVKNMLHLKEKSSMSEPSGADVINPEPPPGPTGPTGNPQ